MEAAVATPPPAAPAASPPPVAPSSAPPISVTPAAIDKGPQAPPPKPGSARDRLSQDLRKKAGMDEPTPETRTPATKLEDSPDATPAPEGEGAPTAPESTVPGAKPKEKVSPWKLVDEHKAARLKAETEAAELRKTMLAPEKVKEIQDRAAAMEKRAQELEEEIRFTNYSKSKEFAEKYQKPYEESWKRWMGEFSELTVANADGSERPVAAQDLLELVNLPLGKAREQAEQLFGTFANDAMTARKEIRGLFEAQNKALEEARKGGEQRDTERVRQMQEQQQKLGQEITELWTKSNELAQKDERFGKFFQPVEGDEEANTRLKKGFEIADRAFSVNPLDPKLTPEQRQEVVRLHSAVRNRAAAFGKLVYQNEKLAAKAAELEAELAKYKNAQPGAGEPHGQQAATGPHSAKESVMADLRKLAH